MSELAIKRKPRESQRRTEKPAQPAHGSGKGVVDRRCVSLSCVDALAEAPGGCCWRGGVYQSFCANHSGGERYGLYFAGCACMSELYY